VDLSKLRRGELIAAVGGIVLLFSLFFLDWFSVKAGAGFDFGNFEVRAGLSADFNAWDGQGFFGTVANLVILAAGIAAVGLAILTATSRTVALPVATGALTTGLGVGAVTMTVARMLLQPGVNDLVDLKAGIYIALAASVAIVFGGWESMQEDATAARGGESHRPGPPPEGSPPPPGH
jgi:hypothetical protein